MGGETNSTDKGLIRRTGRSPGAAALAWAAVCAAPVSLVTLVFATAPPVRAVPAFSDQTGQGCKACHVGGFGPQLTPFGRQFKLLGYTMRAKASLPFSAMVVGSYVHTEKDQNPPTRDFAPNNNWAFDQGSLFVAGGLGEHVGGFAQITYDGVAHQWHWDNLDVRAVTRATVFGQDSVFGVTLNNSPTVQDVWNTTPAWGFLYTSSALAPAPGTAPLISGGLAQEVIGGSAYAWIGQKLYLEAGAYGTPGAGTLGWLGVDPGGGPGSLHGLAPYGRIAYQRDLFGGTGEVGAFALKAAVYPGRDTSAGRTDHYTDVGFDASWIRPVGPRDTLAINLRYIREQGDLQATCALMEADALDCAKYHLDDWRGDITYNFNGKVNLVLSGFSTTGNANGNLYFSPNYKPDSDGIIAQIDYTPWGAGDSPLGKRFNFRVGMQYTLYDRFDGTRFNFDGAGTNASANNTFRTFLWVAY